MSEDDEINFYPPVAGGSVMKGLSVAAYPLKVKYSVLFI